MTTDGPVLFMLIGGCCVLAVTAFMLWRSHRGVPVVSELDQEKP